MFVSFCGNLASFAQNSQMSDTMGLAIDMYRKQEYTKALALITEYTAYTKTNSEAFFLKASIEYELKKLPEALQSVEKALAITKDAEYYLFQGVVYMDLKQYPLAEISFNQSLDFKLNPQVYFNRGQTRRYLNNMQGACYDYNRANKFGNKDAGLLYNKFCK